MILTSNIIAIACSVFCIWAFIYSILTINRGKKALEYFKCSNSTAEKHNKYLQNVVQRQELLIEYYETQIKGGRIDEDTITRSRKFVSELADRLGYKNES